MSKLIRVAVLAVLCQVTVSGQALAGNLVFHQGFETCWVDAIAKATFLQSMESSIDGTTMHSIPGWSRARCRLHRLRHPERVRGGC